MSVPLGEGLPWTLKLSDWTVYSCHDDHSTLPLLSGLSVHSTAGVTVTYKPPMSDVIHSMALCLHLDLCPLSVHLSEQQVDI